MMLDTTIGIVTWNSQKFLKQCLDSVYQNTTNSFSYKIVVVDNGSEDDTIRMVKEEYPDITLIENRQNLGVAKARNQILRMAKGRYVISLDVDTLVCSGTVDTLIETMDAHPEAAVAGPKLVYRDGTLQLSCRPFPSFLNVALEGTFLSKYFASTHYVIDYRMQEWDHRDLRSVDWVYGACLMIRRSALDKLKAFDEGFFYMYEDVDMCFRAWKSGMQVLYIPQATVVHFLEREQKSIFRRTLWVHVRSIFRYLLKDYYGIGYHKRKGFAL